MLLFVSVTRSEAYADRKSQEVATQVMNHQIKLEFSLELKGAFSGAAQLLGLCHALEPEDRIAFDELSSLFLDIPHLLVKGF